MKDKKTNHEVKIDLEFPESIDALMTKPIMSVENVGGYTQNILGKVLTVIDAVIPNAKQAKAIKDVVKNDVWSTYRYIQDWGLEQCDNVCSEFPHEFKSMKDYKEFPEEL